MSHSEHTSNADVLVQTTLGRSSPSGYKIKYLLHLQEYLRTAGQEALQAMNTGRGLVRPPVELSGSLCTVLGYLYEELEDTAYLATELMDLADSIDAIVKLIKEQPAALGDSVVSEACSRG